MTRESWHPGMAPHIKNLNSINTNLSSRHGKDQAWSLFGRQASHYKWKMWHGCHFSLLVTFSLIEWEVMDPKIWKEEETKKNTNKAIILNKK